MSLHYVIDGYNLIKHRSFSFADRFKDGRFALIQFLRCEKPCGSSKNKITVVFDGYPRGMSSQDSDIEIIFSGDESADDRIIRIAGSRRGPRNIVLVSDDRQLTDTVKGCGLSAVGIEEFIAPKKKFARKSDDSSKSELTGSMVRKINKELEDIWLK
ncbi:MAG: NYN domain-containing protein [Candidatus Omnitrophica bacterium]|nr:NYN domain-containing protein [Candidatus Omnitrophota bacterium]MDD5080097.1 NYN domain-containing protein [Candidatus Omnitrophota bacterium]